MPAGEFRIVAISCAVRPSTRAADPTTSAVSAPQVQLGGHRVLLVLVQLAYPRQQACAVGQPYRGEFAIAPPGGTTANWGMKNKYTQNFAIYTLSLAFLENQTKEITTGSTVAAMRVTKKVTILVWKPVGKQLYLEGGGGRMILK